MYLRAILINDLVAPAICFSLILRLKDSFKKLGVSEDLAHKYEDELQKLTEEYNKKIDKQVEDKTKEVMTL